MIRRLDRHVLGRFLPALGTITLAALFLFSLVDFTTRAASFIREGFPTIRVLQFYLYLAPELFTLLAPLVVILAVAWGVGQLARDNEITAMRASGISPVRIAAPVFAVCIGIALLVFFFNERVVTKTHAYIREESLLLREKPTEQELPPQYFYTDDKRGRLYFERYLVKDKIMQQVSWERPATENSPRLQVFADRAGWLGGHWWLFNVRVIRIDRLGKEETSPRRAKRIMYEWDLPPEYITAQKGHHEMTLGEVNRAIRRDREYQPERALEFRLGRHEKLTMPVLVMLVLPLSFPLVVKLGPGRWRAAEGLGLSLGLCFAYYMFYTGMVAIVRKWVPFPPIVWLPNLVYGTAAARLFLRMG
jgi:lipopolysaccharide export system permease protein